MTTAAAVSLHELPEIVVGDLVLVAAPPSERTTIEITVERDASLVLMAPPDTIIERATQFVVDKRQWVCRKLTEKDALTGPPITKQFVEGEGFAYLGRSYRLTLTEQVDDVRLERGRFHMNPSEAGEGVAAMRRWYTTTGTQWLQKRMRPWAARIGRRHNRRRRSRPGLPVGLSPSYRGPSEHQRPLGRPPAPTQPHRLHPRPRTRPPP